MQSCGLRMKLDDCAMCNQPILNYYHRPTPLRHLSLFGIRYSNLRGGIRCEPQRRVRNEGGGWTLHSLGEPIMVDRSQSVVGVEAWHCGTAWSCMVLEGRQFESSRVDQSASLSSLSLSLIFSLKPMLAIHYYFIIFEHYLT